MTRLNESRWSTPLRAAFQDEQNLYLVMDFLPGGDLASLLLRSEEGLSLASTIFYIAEIILGLKDLHAIGFVHRY